MVTAIGADTLNLLYGVENRLTSVTGFALAVSFVYDGDGKRVKSVLTTNPSTGSGQALGTSTTIFVGSHYEVTDGVVTKYYFAGAQRIAMRTNGTLSYILGDHLGSTSMVTDSSGSVLSQQKYKAWGETRYASGSMSTRYQYTGQFSHASEFGLLFYNARMYDPQLGRFASADSIVPGGVQGLDRYAYAFNNPMLYNDPSGHCPECIGITIILTIDVTLHVFGLIPDHRGINYAQEHVTNGDILVAAGLAVQSEWYIHSWDDPKNEGASSYGPAQALEEELNGRDPHNPATAVSIITERINDVVGACPNCIDRDKVILAALAQNGSEYALDSLKNVSGRKLLEDGGLDWVNYFNSLDKKGNIYEIRAIGRHNIDSRFQLNLFMNNLEELGRRGWKLPVLSSSDWGYINRLRWGRKQTAE